MSNKEPHSIHRVEDAHQLEGAFRKLLHNPRRILKKYIREGMTVIDFGCGPGFFTVESAKLAGKSGKVIAVDVQKGMLELARQKIRNTEFEHKVTLHRCSPHAIGLTEEADFILAFYAIHEVSDKERVLHELASLLKSGGQMLIAEQKGHVSRSEFEEITRIALRTGLRIAHRPKIVISRAMLLTKSYF